MASRRPPAKGRAQRANTMKTPNSEDTNPPTASSPSPAIPEEVTPAQSPQPPKAVEESKQKGKRAPAQRARTMNPRQQGKDAGKKPSQFLKDDIPEEEEDPEVSDQVKEDVERAFQLTEMGDAEAEEESKSPQPTKRKKPAIVYPFEVNDLLFPGGRVSKLCKIKNHQDIKVKQADVVSKLGIAENNPVIMLVGVDNENHARTLSSVVRAAFNTDAVIIDNGLHSGIEILAHRRGVKLIGVCPELHITYPTATQNDYSPSDLTPHHSIISLGSRIYPCKWEDTVQFKIDFAERIQNGSGAGRGSYQCKGVVVFAGDSEIGEYEVRNLARIQWPIIVLKDTELGKKLSSNQKTDAPEELTSEEAIVKVFTGTGDALVNLIHAYLTISIS